MRALMCFNLLSFCILYNGCWSSSMIVDTGKYVFTQTSMRKKFTRQCMTRCLCDVFTQIWKWLRDANNTQVSNTPWHTSWHLRRTITMLIQKMCLHRHIVLVIRVPTRSYVSMKPNLKLRLKLAQRSTSWRHLHEAKHRNCKQKRAQPGW